MEDAGHDDCIVRLALEILDHLHDTGALVAAAVDSNPRHVWELVAAGLTGHFGQDRSVDERRALRHTLLNPYLPVDIGCDLTRAAVAAAVAAGEPGGAGFGVTAGLLSDITAVFVNPNSGADAITAIAETYPSIFVKHTLVGAHLNTSDDAYIAAMTHPSRAALGDLLNFNDLPTSVLEHLSRCGDSVVRDRVRQHLTGETRPV